MVLCTDVRNCWSVKQINPSRPPIQLLCLRQLWKICVTEVPRVSLSLSRTVTQSQPHSLKAAGWRTVWRSTIFNRRLQVRVLCVSELRLCPTEPVCGLHSSVTSRKEKAGTQNGITYYIINTPCHHCILLSWTCSHSGSTLVSWSRTTLASTHCCCCIPGSMLSL